MKTHRKRPPTSCPATTAALRAEARQRFERVLTFCLHSDLSFWKFEKCLLALLAVLGRLLVRQFLTARHERLDLEPYLQDGVHRLDHAYADRTVKTAWGAVRHVVGERLDCSGMRWTQAKAEALLQLRCLELNGDWERFCVWTHERHQERLSKRQRVKILTDQPLDLARAA